MPFVKGSGRKGFWISCGLIAGAYLVLIAGIGPAFGMFSRMVDVNSVFQAEQLLKSGNPGGAVALARQQIKRETYDFRARFLLASAQAAAGRYPDATATIRELLARAAIARGRPVFTRGFDEPRCYDLLWQFAWKSGHYLHAADLFGLAFDVSPIGLDQQFRDVVTSCPTSEAIFAAGRINWLLGSSRHDLPTKIQPGKDKKPGKFKWDVAYNWEGLAEAIASGNPQRLKIAQANAPRERPFDMARTADLKHAKGVSEGELLRNGHLVLLRKNEVTIQAPGTVAAGVGYLILMVKGHRVAGKYPEIGVTVDGKDVGSFYPCWPPPGMCIVRVPVPLKAGSEIGLRILNEAYDPVLKTHRSAEILMLAFV